MKVSAIEEYGIRCMVLLARQDGGSLTLPEISEAEGLSISYAGKLLNILKKASLVKSVRGRLGGYGLAVPPENLPLNKIFEALGEPLYTPKRHCNQYTGEKEECVHTQDCTVRGMWRGFSKIISGVLGKLTLKDLASGEYDFDTICKNTMENNISDRQRLS